MDQVTEVRVFWRQVPNEVQQTSVQQTLIPRDADSATYPLYVHFTTHSGWCVYHAGSHIHIHSGMRRDQAIKFMFAIENMIDWSLPVQEILIAKKGLIPKLHQAALDAGGR